MRNLIFTFIMVFSVLVSKAQDYNPQSQFAKDFFSVWKVSMQNAIDVAEAMPEELYGYKPADSSKTFGDQIGHIAFVTPYLAKGFVSADWGEYKDPDTRGMTKVEIIEMLKASLKEATEIIAAMTEEQANETIKAFGGKMLKRYVTILFIQDHLSNHRAKANLYIRINGIKPPDYAFFN